MSLHFEKKCWNLKKEKIHAANGSTKWQVVIATVYQTLPLGLWAFYSCRTWSHRCTCGCRAAGSCTGSPASLCCTNQLPGLVSAGSFPMVKPPQYAIPTHLLFVFTPCFLYRPHRGKCKYTHGPSLQARSSNVVSLCKLKVTWEAEMLLHSTHNKGRIVKVKASKHVWSANR